MILFFYLKEQGIDDVAEWISFFKQFSRAFGSFLADLWLLWMKHKIRWAICFIFVRIGKQFSYNFSMMWYCYLQETGINDWVLDCSIVAEQGKAVMVGWVLL